MSEKPEIILENAMHNEESVILIRFTYNRELINAVKSIQGSCKEGRDTKICNTSQFTVQFRHSFTGAGNKYKVHTGDTGA